ncbi:hypothetical protein HZH68_010247 [Vespula germanica]|uniref:Uncharacterized protein n=1 Tax=Vespula germanica TaxID=30212 RepID=A0A834JRF2_VESGE|nr:hypothetical protein HZH68_010247 [Vespula germanica]
MICSINMDIEEIDKQFTSITEFEGEHLNENGNAFDICRLKTDTARTKTKDRSFTSVQESTGDIEETDNQFTAMIEFERENLNENHNAFDTGRLKTDNTRIKTKDRALGQCKKELKMTALSIILKENLNENHNAFDTGRLKTDNTRIKTKDRALGQSKLWVNGDHINENHNDFDTSRLKTDNTRTKTKDRALGQYKKELKITKLCRLNSTK